MCADGVDSFNPNNPVHTAAHGLGSFDPNNPVLNVLMNDLFGREKYADLPKRLSEIR
jgi:hypothetical protein